jgi:hypothetical protein
MSPWRASRREGSPIDRTDSTFVVLQTPVTSALIALAGCTANVPRLPPHR